MFNIRRKLICRLVFETLFDIVYLTTVIVLGIRMIMGSHGQKQYLFYGAMAVILGCGDAFHLVPRAIALLTTGLAAWTAVLGIGKLITSITMTGFYVLLYYVWRSRYEVSGGKRYYSGGLVPVCLPHRTLPDAAECMDKRIGTPFLGNLQEHSLCASGDSYHSAVLPERR
jgi:hypothetical protein